MLWIHVGSGSLALVAGFIALYAPKGGPTHVRAGRAFVVAMVTMTASAAIAATALRPNPGNAVAASMTFYLVASGWLALRAGPERTRLAYVALATLAAGISVCNAVLFGAVWQLPGRVLEGIPAAALLMFGTVLLFAVVGDVRTLRRGHLQGPGRLLRHLWRMGFAMWIATTSFFLGQADELPAVLRQGGWLVVPVLAVTATWVYWVARQGLRVRSARRRPAPPRSTLGVSDAA
jgi:hypothetical protein